ncbi:hypothetical protein D3C76_901360 [compost metagenome]|uniref:Secreted protein n=1 Tax=Pseudomonas jinjuensis TaxID=198616 RepID=A0A1H0A7N3_9PSED|nr:hypothetical protein [Pseudomonas jinjuensis]SDN29679.1 hypothetical protein SAMN05216193_102128 [Pseudomonas jinjuensis]
MKATYLIIATALLAGPVFAADEDVCSTNIQKIDESMKNTAASDATVQDQVMRLQEKALQAQAAGDTKGCVASSSEALKLLKRSGADS